MHRHAVFSAAFRWRLLLIVLTLVGLNGASWLAPAAAAQTSPAGDHTQVIAQGIAELPAPEVSWQALFFSAGPLDPVNPINADGQSLQSPGFLLATTGPFLTVSPDGDLRHRLNPGEAAFTPGEALLNPLSESTDLVPFVAITLAATSGPKSATGIPFYAGEAFAVEPSVHDFDLVRGVLDPGQLTQLDGGEIPAFFLTLEGQLELRTPEGDSAVLETEQAVTYAGPITITNVGSSRAVFVSAIVGDEITVANAGAPTASTPRRVAAQPVARPAAPAPAARPAAPAPVADRGTITLRAFTCPPRAADGSFDPGACAPLTSGFEAQLNKIVDGSVLRLSQAARDGNAFRWSGLTVNPDNAQNLMVYTPSQPVTPAGYVDFDITGDISNVGTVALMASKPNAEIAIYNFAAPPAPSYGSFMIDVSTCPVPVNPAQPNLGECGAYDPPGGAAAVLAMSLSSGTSVLSPDSSQANIAVWENLPPGTYTLNQNAASEGFHSVRIGDQTLVCCQAGALSLNIDTSQGDVSRTLFLYFQLDGAGPANTDSDADGLTDKQEGQMGTNPQLADTDGDGLTDFEEVEVFESSPIVADMDGDGITDGDEVAQGSDPFDEFDPLAPAQAGPDADGDRLSDERELQIGTNPQSIDTGGDGLGDFDEVDIYQSNPQVADMDGDGISDGDEIQGGSNPFDEGDPGNNALAPDAAGADSDADGLLDDEEAALGIDPFNADSDGDGMLDGEELSLGFDPLFPDQ